MKMKRILMLGLLGMVMVASLAAQTRRIGHRSHSGSPSTFAMMMDEDHLGGPVKMPLASMHISAYEVDPFIARIRKHYESIAKLPAPVATPQAESPKLEKGSDPAPGQSSPETKTPALAPKASTPKNSIPKLAAIPAPDFLVAARSNPITAIKDQATNSESSFWMLILLLGIPVAPVVFVASTVWSRQNKPA